MAAYARRRYARLSFDRYIESQREGDWLAGLLMRNEPTLVNIGAAEMAANSPVGIKKGMRYPGAFHIEYIKITGQSDVVEENEDFTSQTCANYFREFPLRIRKYLIKLCKECTRYAPMRPEICTVYGTTTANCDKEGPTTQTIRFRRQKTDCEGHRDSRLANHSNEIQPGRLESKQINFIKNWFK